MQEAYKIANLIWQQNLSKEDKEALESFSPDQILVIPGEYDKIREVLNVLGIPHVEGLPNAKSRKLADVILVNCPGDALSRHIRGVKTWIQKGGFLVTTDWAVRPLQEMFPSHIRWTGGTTADECVEIDHMPNVLKIMAKEEEIEENPIWWLEGASYPFRVAEGVEILLTSKELKERYGSSLVAVQWDYGEGKVVHIISHLYLQRTELRTSKAASKVTEMAFTYDVDKSLINNLDSSAMLVSKGEIDASLSSSQFLLNTLLDASKTKQGNEKKPSQAPISEVTWVD